MRYKTIGFMVLLIGLVWLPCPRVNAQCSFGNTPNGGSSFRLTEYNGSTMEGGAVEFVPTENIDLASVTLWLSGYDGAYGVTLEVGIFSSIAGGYNGGTATSYPSGGLLLSLTCPEHNDGSLAPFTFTDPVGNPYSNPSGSTVLSANIAYWLQVLPLGTTLGYQYGKFIYWAGGGTPTGNAIYNGSVCADWYGAHYDASTVTPAFTINAVPEPHVGTLIVLCGSIIVVGSCWRKRQLPAGKKPISLDGK